MISVKAATTVNKLSFSLIQNCWSMIVFNDATKENPVWQPTLSTMNQQQISFWSLGYYFTCSFSQSTYLFFWCNLYLCSAEIIIFDNWAGWTFVGLLVSNKDCGRKFGERLWAYETVVSGEERLSDGQKMKKAKARRCAGKETQLGLEVYAAEKVGPISRNVILLRCSANTGSHLFKLTDRCHLDCYCCWSICRLRSHFHIFHWHFYQIRNLSVLCVSAWWGGLGYEIRHPAFPTCQLDSSRGCMRWCPAWADLFIGARRTQMFCDLELSHQRDKTRFLSCHLVGSNSRFWRAAIQMCRSHYLSLNASFRFFFAMACPPKTP